MGRCNACERSAATISNRIGYCSDCVRTRFDEIWPNIQNVHQKSRRAYGLPVSPPRALNGVTCSLCLHECRIPEGHSGFCGLRRVENGRLKGGRPHEGNLSYYFDPLPTNCVGDFVCPAGTDCGYPTYSFSKGPEYGYHNLAVFYKACSFNCLYCQNYHFKIQKLAYRSISASELAGKADRRTTCICYFGGDPGPQVLHAIKTSKIALKNTDTGILRICWETNGAMHLPYLKIMADLSLRSGGCIKFDLKAWDERIHYSLCGVSNRRTLENFQTIAGCLQKRTDPLALIASTLLVPGYVDEEEVAGISAFIATQDPEIPYRLLAFYPTFYLNDLPTTSWDQAFRCKAAAERAGLRRVHIGNVHLL